MIKFIKESIKEFEHVVWPTPNETKKYFYIVVTMITVFTIFLFIAWNIFSKVLFLAKDNLNLSSKYTDNSVSDNNILNKNIGESLPNFKDINWNMTTTNSSWAINSTTDDTNNATGLTDWINLNVNNLNNTPILPLNK